MKVVGTSMVLESWNANLLGEPLALNFVATMDDNSTMEPRSPPSSPPPPKPPDLSLHEVASGFIVDPPWSDTKEEYPVSVNDSILKDEKEKGGSFGILQRRYNFLHSEPCPNGL